MKHPLECDSIPERKIDQLSVILCVSLTKKFIGREKIKSEGCCTGRLASNQTWHLLAELKQRARHLKAETFALYLAGRDPRTPWYAKLLVAGMVAYAFSPIDLIPDFVPVPGYLDDLILIPAGIALAIRLVADAVLADCRAQAQVTFKNGRLVSRIAGVVIVVIWIALAALCIVWVYQAFMLHPEILFGQTIPSYQAGDR